MPFGDAPASELVINEVMADAAFDTNGDGVHDIFEDELIELLLLGTEPLDLSGATISDATGVRATLPQGTVLATMQYGSIGGQDQSLNRSVELDPEAPFVLHGDLGPSAASPGTRADGTLF